ncbi:MAG: efflux RND transporter periplasmic adaptor subunit [Planctomycetes bacterium]|nr:efflux RND transporter periplasmic adaptor subunit [Planctomycetota bacterium]
MIRSLFKSKITLILSLGLVTLLIGSALGWFSRNNDDASTAYGAVVKRGPLTISVLQRGTMSSKNSAKVKSELEGESQVLYLIDEGTTVEKGDLVAELDASKLIDRKIEQVIASEAASANYVSAQQEYSIQESQNKSDIAKAQQSLSFAQMDLEKYIEGDWPQQLQKSDESIELAKEELTQAKDKLEWSVKLSDKGFLTRTELEADQLQHNRMTIMLQQEQRAKKLLEEYDYPKQMALLNSAVTEAESELVRVKLQAQAYIVNKETARAASQSKSELENEKLAKIASQISKAKLYAPDSGIVVYARAQGRRSEEIIEEGAMVRERQELISIPKRGGMMAEISVHESVLKNVKEGLKCRIVVDALPDVTLTGVVEFVALLPDKGSWWSNPNLRLFPTRVSIADAKDNVASGMSCSVEIIVAELDDVVYMPLQSVFVSDGQTVCFIDSKPVAVELGLSNEKWVEIKSGVAPGDIVALSPPDDFMQSGYNPEKE